MAHNARWFMAMLFISGCNAQGGENQFRAPTSDSAADDQVDPGAGVAEPVVASCSLTSPEVVLNGLDGPWDYKVDDRFFYYIDTSQGFSLNRVDKNGGGAAAEQVGGFLPASARYDYALSPSQIFV